MPVITMARQTGAGGEAIATQVAGRLRLRLIDRQYLHHAARAAGLAEDTLLELEWQGHRNVVARVISALRHVQPATPGSAGASPLPALADDTDEADDDGGPERPPALRVPPLSPLDGIFSPVLRSPSMGLNESVQHLGRLMHRLAAGGDCLFIGSGSQVWLRDWPGVLHVLVMAPLHRRIASVEERSGVSHKTAQQRVRDSDRSRAQYMRRYHGVDWLDPNLYDLVINTADIPIALAVEFIIAAARKLAVESRTTTAAYQRGTSTEASDATEQRPTSLLTGVQTEDGSPDL